MTRQPNRRRFLQTSLVAGTALTLAGGTTPLGSEPLRPAPSAAGEPVDRRVRPGQVRWHADFAAACAAGERSGKPVLLFQMMGRLDQKLC